MTFRWVFTDKVNVWTIRGENVFQQVFDLFTTNVLGVFSKDTNRTITDFITHIVIIKRHYLVNGTTCNIEVEEDEEVSEDINLSFLRDSRDVEQILNEDGSKETICCPVDRFLKDNPIDEEGDFVYDYVLNLDITLTYTVFMKKDGEVVYNEDIGNVSDKRL